MYVYIYIYVHLHTHTYRRQTWYAEARGTLSTTRTRLRHTRTLIYIHLYIYIYIYTCIFTYTSIQQAELVGEGKKYFDHYSQEAAAYNNVFDPVTNDLAPDINRWEVSLSLSLCMKVCVCVCVCDLVNNNHVSDINPWERWGAGVETQKNVRKEIGGWGRVPFNEPYAPLLSTIYDGA